MKARLTCLNMMLVILLLAESNRALPLPPSEQKPALPQKIANKAFKMWSKHVTRPRKDEVMTPRPFPSSTAATSDASSTSARSSWSSSGLSSSSDHSFSPAERGNSAKEKLITQHKVHPPGREKQAGSPLSGPSVHSSPQYTAKLGLGVVPGQSRWTTLRQDVFWPTKNDMRKQKEYLAQERKKEYDLLIEEATLKGPRMSEDGKKRLAELRNEYHTEDARKENFCDEMKILPPNEPLTLSLTKPGGWIPTVSTYGPLDSANRRKYDALKDKAIIKGKLWPWERSKLKKLHKEFSSPMAYHHNFHDRMSLLLMHDEPVPVILGPDI